MAGDAGQHVDPGLGMQVEADLPRLAGKGGFRHQRKRRRAQLQRVQAQQEVMHHWVADDGELENVIRLDAAFPRRLGGQFVDRVAHHLGRFVGVGGVEL